MRRINRKGCSAHNHSLLRHKIIFDLTPQREAAEQPIQEFASLWGNR